MALAIKVRSGVDVELPSEPTKPSSDMGDYITLLYGEKKVGKTSMCSFFPDVYFLMFEAGGKGLSIKQSAVPDWATYLAYMARLKENPGYCKTLVIDTIDQMYDRCFEYVCKRDGMTHPSDEQWGKGWKAVSEEFTRGLNLAIHYGGGLILTSHADQGTFKKQNGTEFNKMVPTMKGQAARQVVAAVDNIIYYGYYGNERRLTIQGSDSVEAGSRCAENFWVKDTHDGTTRDVETRYWERPNPNYGKQPEPAGDTSVDLQSDQEFIRCGPDDPGAIEKFRYDEETVGTRVHSVPAGNGPRDTYANLMKAFRNEQVDDGKPARSTGPSERKVTAFKK